jgi:hypothetical protein
MRFTFSWAFNRDQSGEGPCSLIFFILLSISIFLREEREKKKVNSCGRPPRTCCNAASAICVLRVDLRNDIIKTELIIKNSGFNSALTSFQKIFFVNVV